MSLLSIAQKIKEDGFDPRKERAQFNISEKGWESLGFTFEVREEGEFNGRTEYVSFGTLSEWNGKDLSWSVERTIKFFTKAIELAGDKVMKNDFEDGRALADALERKAVGSYFTLKILETKGKEDKVYRNYDIEENAENVMNTIDVEEDDLPF